MRLQRALTVHPHTRGEHGATSRRRCGKTGSSPRTRGTRFAVTSEASMYRFIPTHAGNTPAKFAEIISGSVHPHTRGEHVILPMVKPCYSGSSPHTRGTQVLSALLSTFTRFIPTHAGNTLMCPSSDRPIPVHPHTRGEHLAGCAYIVVFTGSSPHTRGTLRHWWATVWLLRFIPTHAGNTRAEHWRCPVPAVHPHTRGEHNNPAALDIGPYGSSPHTRGTLHLKGLKHF